MNITQTSDIQTVIGAEGDNDNLGNVDCFFWPLNKIVFKLFWNYCWAAHRGNDGRLMFWFFQLKKLKLEKIPLHEEVEGGVDLSAQQVVLLSLIRSIKWQICDVWASSRAHQMRSSQTSGPSCDMEAGLDDVTSLVCVGRAWIESAIWQKVIWDLKITAALKWMFDSLVLYAVKW